MLRSRIFSAVAFIVLLVAALIILAAVTPAGAQFVAGLSEIFATPIPLSGVEAVNSPWPTPEPRPIYIASDSLQSPLQTPMP